MTILNQSVLTILCRGPGVSFPDYFHFESLSRHSTYFTFTSCSYFI